MTPDGLNLITYEAIEDSRRSNGDISIACVKVWHRDFISEDTSDF